MALLKYREPNQVLWRGVRPAHDGTQVLEHNAVTDGSLDIYDVPAGKTFYLCSWNLTLYVGAVGDYAILLIRTAVPADWERICVLKHKVAGGAELSGNFWPPLEIPAGYHATITSNTATSDVYGMVHGWIE